MQATETNHRASRRPQRHQCHNRNVHVLRTTRDVAAAVTTEACTDRFLTKDRRGHAVRQ